MTTLNHDFTIIIDTREQQPWSFEHFTTAHKKLDTGDYSIEGLEHLLAIERKKSVSEFANNITESRFRDVIDRMSKMKYSFLLLEFDLSDVLSYPIGSTVPKKMWDKIKISPAFIIKNLLDLELFHNIQVIYCGGSSDAEAMASHILKKVNYLERYPKKDV